MKKNIIQVCVFLSVIFSQTIEEKIKQGMVFMQSEHWSEAATVFQYMLDNDSSGTLNVYFELTQCYYKLGDLNNSLGNWGKAYVLDPENTEIRKFRIEEINEAIITFQSILNLDPEDTDALFNLGKIFYYLYEIDNSYQHLNQALQIDASFEDVREFQRNVIVPDSLRKAGRKAFTAGDLNTSDDVFTNLSEIYPGYSMSYYYLGMSQFARKEDEAGLYFIKKAIQLEWNQDQKERYQADLTNFVKKYYQNGITEHRRSNMAVAKEKYLKAVMLDPNFFQAYSQLGWVFLKESDYNRAVDAFQNAIIGNPNYAKSHYGLGMVFYKQGLYEKSLKVLQKAVDLETEYEKAHYQIGVINMELKRNKLAIAAFQKALKAKPDYGKAYYSLGRVYVDSENNYEEAITFLNKAIDFGDKKTKFKSYAYLAECYNKLNKYNQALNASTDCLKIKDNYALALIEKGHALRKLGLDDEAVTTYEKARSDSRWRETADYWIDQIRNAEKYE